MVPYTLNNHIFYADVQVASRDAFSLKNTSLPAPCTEYNIHGTMDSSEQYTVHCTLNTIKYTLNNVLYNNLYSVPSPKLYTILNKDFKVVGLVPSLAPLLASCTLN